MSAIPNDLKQLPDDLTTLPDYLKQLPADLTTLPGNPTPQQAQDMLRHLRESWAIAPQMAQDELIAKAQNAATHADTNTLRGYANAAVQPVRDAEAMAVRAGVGAQSLLGLDPYSSQEKQAIASGVQNLETPPVETAHGIGGTLVSLPATGAEATVPGLLPATLIQHGGEVTLPNVINAATALFAPEVAKVAGPVVSKFLPFGNRIAGAAVMGGGQAAANIAAGAPPTEGVGLAAGLGAVGGSEKEIPRENTPGAGHEVAVAGERGTWHDRFANAPRPWIDALLKGGPQPVPPAAVPSNLQPATPPVETKVPENVLPKIIPKPPRGIKIAEPTEGPLSTVLKPSEPAGPDVVQKWQGQQVQSGWRPAITEEMRRRAGQTVNPATAIEAVTGPLGPQTPEEKAAISLFGPGKPGGAINPTPRPAPQIAEGFQRENTLAALLQPREATSIAAPTKPTVGEKLNAAVRSVFHPEGSQALAEQFGTAANVKMNLTNRMGDWVKDFGKLSAEEQERNHDAMNKTGEFISPSLKKHEPLFHATNNEINRQYATLGVNAEELRPNWFTMSVFQDPEASGGTNTTKKLGDAENYFKQNNSFTIATAKKYAAEKGLVMEPNLAEGQLRAWANQADSLAARNSLMDAVKRGSETTNVASMLSRATGGRGAEIIKANDPLPPNMEELPGWLANDQAFIKATGQDTGQGTQRIVIDPGLKAAMDGWKQSTRGTTNRLVGGTLRLKLLFDAVNGLRAVNGVVSDALTGHAHGVQEGITAMRGRLDPEQSEVLAHAQQYGFHSDILPSPKDVAAKKTLFPGSDIPGKVLNFPRNFAEVAKVSAVMEGTRHIMGDTDLTQAQHDTAMQRLLKLADNQYGGKTKPDTLPTSLQAPLNALSPLLGYETAQARMAGRALTGDTTALRGLIGNATIFLGVNGLLTYALTGRAPKGEDFLHFATGKKDKDGVEIRGHLPGIMSNFVDDVVSAGQGRWGDIISRKINPQVTAIAESLTGRDYQGNPLTSEGRVTNIAKNLIPLMPTQTHFWESPEQREYEGQGFPWEAQAIGVRGESKKEERSRFLNAAYDVRQATRSPLDPTAQQVQQQRFEWMDRLGNEGLTQNLQPVIAEMIKAGYDKDQIKSLVRTSQMPGGIPRMAQTLEPQQLAQIWDKASKQEKLQMLPILRDRVHNRKDTESPQTQQGWLDLIRKF
jgi:hypothetical protein